MCAASLTVSWASAANMAWTTGNNRLSCMPPAISPAVQLSDDMQQHITLLARGAVLPNNGRLLVFDDISEIVSAQRAQAWGEVARRLAHEIKNPLTPIQLSAERLEMKLTGKLQEPEQLILNKSVKTIVDQVDAMKRLVNEFRDYARLPVADLKATGPECLGARCDAALRRRKCCRACVCPA